MIYCYGGVHGVGVRADQAVHILYAYAAFQFVKHIPQFSTSGVCLLLSQITQFPAFQAPSLAHHTLLSHPFSLH